MTLATLLATSLVAAIPSILTAPPSPAPAARRAAPTAAASPALTSGSDRASDSGAFVRGVVARPVAADDRIPEAARPFTAVLSVDEAALARLAAAGGGVAERFPLGATLERSLVLLPIDPFASDAVVEIMEPDGRGGAVARAITPSGLHFIGTVVGEIDSSVFLSSTPAGVFGFVSFADERFIISSGRLGEGLPILSYDLGRIPEGLLPVPDWACGTPAPEGGAGTAGGGEGGVAGGQPCRQVRVAFETDNEFLSNLFGGNTDAATGYVGTLAVALTTIYTRDVNARLAVHYLRLWTATDPWSGGDTGTQLNQFVSYWQANMTLQREVAHFLSGRNLGGGVAYLNGLCGSLGYGVSANLAGGFPTPIVDNSGQNWDIMVVAHELGHNFGAPHTHDYSPPVDGCGSSPQDCSVANADEGTIMSYCHLCSGGVQNIKLIFHPASIASMEAHMSQMGCSITGSARPPLTVADHASAAAGEEILIDVMANDLPFNCESIEIESFVQGVYGGIVERRVGAGPEGRDVLAYRMPSAGYNGQDIFTYRLVDASSQTWSGAVYVDVSSVREPENPVGTEASLAVDYFALSQPSSLPDFSTLTAYASSLAAPIDYPSTTGAFADSGRTNNVGALYTGWIEIPTSGIWTLYSNSDDGSRVFIGNQLVVDNDGQHAAQERSGAIGLGAGRHAIRVEYFERSSSCTLSLRWEGPATPKAVVPASRLSHGGTLEPADLNGDGVVGAEDLAILLASWGQSGGVADINRDGQVNGQDLAGLLSAWTN